MKEKIFQQLKQKYSNLGLSDEILRSVANSLEASGLVTDENLETVIAGQESVLKSYQSSLDKMRTENANYKKELEELKESVKQQPKADEIPDWFRKYKEEQEEKIKSLTTANETAKAEKARTERNNLILSLAKKAGIPEWRIKEGFVISDDMDESTIDKYMLDIKQNIVTNSLEGKSGKPFLPKGEATKEDAEAIVTNMRI